MPVPAGEVAVMLLVLLTVKVVAGCAELHCGRTGEVGAGDAH